MEISDAFQSTVLSSTQTAVITVSQTVVKRIIVSGEINLINLKL